jgi:geranylgeranylglycerol-phosphate geranylgeranyltransferase
VAASVAIPYIFGSIAVGQVGVNLAYLLALTSFLAGLGREILKGISDVQGDRIRNVKTLAATKGPIFAARSTAVFFLAAVVSSLLPLILSELGNTALLYSVLIFIPDAIFIFLTYKVLNLRKDEKISKLKKIALGGMLSGLIAYLIAGIY